MARARKRVLALRRAADGSAFEKCDCCGISVAIALADMHECEPNKKEMKRFRELSANNEFNGVREQSFADQPRSAFCFFMEALRETSDEECFIDIDKKGFEMWKNMSGEERKPYEIQAGKVNAAHYAALLDEVKAMGKLKVDDGANSPMLWKFDMFLEEYDDCEDSDCSESSQSSDSYEWEWSSDDS